MTRHDLATEVVDRTVYDRTVQRFRERRAAIPTFAQLADPTRVPPSVHAAVSRATLSSFGLSSICNVLAAIKTAKRFGFGANDAVVTVATDGASMYRSERDRVLSAQYPDGFDDVAAAEVFGEHLLGIGTDDVADLTETDRQRIFNLGYFTWVEQQDVPIEEFTARRRPGFWADVRSVVEPWDAMIDEFNARTGVLSAP